MIHNIPQPSNSNRTLDMNRSAIDAHRTYEYEPSLVQSKGGRERRTRTKAPGHIHRIV